MAMTKQFDYYANEEEIEMLNALISELQKIGAYQITSIELLSDSYSSFLVSLKSADFVNPEQMTKLHTVAQEVSDRFDRNLVVSTTNFSEGGRRVAYVPDSNSDNVVQLNPNKPERRKSAAAALPPTEVTAESSAIYVLENACESAMEFKFRGFEDESKRITEKSAKVAIALVKRGKLSLSTEEVETICLDIAQSFVEHQKRTDAEDFLVEVGFDASWFRERLDIYESLKEPKKQKEVELVRMETERVLEDLEALF
jgi:hypothetical protein